MIRSQLSRLTQAGDGEEPDEPRPIVPGTESQAATARRRDGAPALMRPERGLHHRHPAGSRWTMRAWTRPSARPRPAAHSPCVMPRDGGRSSHRLVTPAVPPPPPAEHRAVERDLVPDGPTGHRPAHGLDDAGGPRGP